MIYELYKTEGDRRRVVCEPFDDNELGDAGGNRKIMKFG